MSSSQKVLATMSSGKRSAKEAKDQEKEIVTKSKGKQDGEAVDKDTVKEPKKEKKDKKDKKDKKEKQEKEGKEGKKEGVEKSKGEEEEMADTDGKETKAANMDFSAAIDASVIAKPLFDGKLAERSVKLIKAAVEAEKLARKSKGGKADKKRLIRRGVAEVSKSIRKGEKGLVFFAADVFPEDIFAHLPVYCEEQNVVYGFLGSKKLLGQAVRSCRPASVVMIVSSAESNDALADSYKKVYAAAFKANPYLH